LPPEAFVEAVLQCPGYGSPEYFDSLREANEGHAVPLITWNEHLIESRKQTEELIGRKKPLLDKAPQE
jgi:hypothetical protein